MMNFATGWNMASYSPDPENIWITDDYESAVAYLLDTVEHWSDGDYMGNVCDCACHERERGKRDECECATNPDLDSPNDIDARYEIAFRDLANAGTGPEFSTVVYDSNGYPYTFWITATDEEMSDE